MSKTNYGLLAFKQGFPEDTPDPEIVRRGRAAEMNAVLEKHGAELTTIKDVFDKTRDGNQRIAEMDFSDAAKPGEAEE